MTFVSLLFLCQDSQELMYHLPNKIAPDSRKRRQGYGYCFYAKIHKS
ncbi:hypothetical protein [Eisenibacter elegans]|nr:hypothetical protein [Eisenibacter elegans]